MPDEPITPTPPDPAAEDTRIQSALERALSKTVAPAFQALRQEVAAVKQQASQPAPGPAPDPKSTPDDYTQLVQDPRSFVRSVAVDDISRTMGPAMLQLFNQNRDSLIRQEESQVDAEFGEGFFKSEISEKLQAALKELAPDRQADPQVVNATVSALLGMSYRDAGKMQELNDKRAKVAKAKEAPPEMLRNGRPVPGRGTGTKASPEEVEFISRLERAGVEMSINDYVKSRETPNTLSAWQDRLASERTASAKKGA